MDLTHTSTTEIIGQLSGEDQNDVNVFKISNRLPMLFSAITVFPGALGIPDTVLTLFDANGRGVFMNDDISGDNTLSCLPSLASNPCSAAGMLLPAGFYYLAISRAANYAMDELGNEIFMPAASTELALPVSTYPMAGWDGGAFASPDYDLVKYDIQLNGTVPEPGAWLLTLSGGALLLGILRRRR